MTVRLHPCNYSMACCRSPTPAKPLLTPRAALPAPAPQDPEASKPEDWDEREMIPDPEDVKPSGWDDIPANIADPEAKKPEDWDDEDDGEWEPPVIPNPEYKGKCWALTMQAQDQPPLRCEC